MTSDTPVTRRRYSREFKAPGMASARSPGRRLPPVEQCEVDTGATRAHRRESGLEVTFSYANREVKMSLRNFALPRTKSVTLRMRTRSA